MTSERYSTFSSSRIWELVKFASREMTQQELLDHKKAFPKSKKKNIEIDGFSEKGLKYIKQVGQEIKLKRAINKEATAKPTSWGTLNEMRVFNMLGMDYRLISKERLVHSKIPNFSGMPDLIRNGDTTSDVKCPYSLEVFCDKIDALEKGVEIYKDEFPADFWQNVSSTILLRDAGFPITHFEAIIYVPYEDELTEIRDAASNYDGNQNDLLFLNYAMNDELPFLKRDGFYKNLNIYKFPVPEEDVTFLESRIIAAGALLEKR